MRRAPFAGVVRLAEDLAIAWKTFGAANQLTDGPRIPLKDLSSVKVVEGPALINRNMGKRRISSALTCRPRPGWYVKELQEKVERQVQMPAGYYIEWVASFTTCSAPCTIDGDRAHHHCCDFPSCCSSSFSQCRFAALIITVLPWRRSAGYSGCFSPASIFRFLLRLFIALWGIAVLNGVVLVSYIRKLREEGLTQANAIREGTRLRFRPVMMTATVAALGLVPFLFATGPGLRFSGRWRSWSSAAWSVPRRSRFCYCRCLRCFRG